VKKSVVIRFVVNLAVVVTKSAVLRFVVNMAVQTAIQKYFTNFILISLVKYPNCCMAAREANKADLLSVCLHAQFNKHSYFAIHPCKQSCDTLNIMTFNLLQSTVDAYNLT
jgi:hypothetical protein